MNVKKEKESLVDKLKKLKGDPKIAERIIEAIKNPKIIKDGKLNDVLRSLGIDTTFATFEGIKYQLEKIAKTMGIYPTVPEVNQKSGNLLQKIKNFFSKK